MEVGSGRRTDFRGSAAVGQTVDYSSLVAFASHLTFNPTGQKIAPRSVRTVERVADLRGVNDIPKSN